MLHLCKKEFLIKRAKKPHEEKGAIVKYIKPILLYILCQFLLAGCHPAAAVEAAATATDIPQTTPTQQVDPLEKFEINLVREYRPVLEQMAAATRYDVQLTIAEDIVTVEGHQDVLYTNCEDTDLEVVYFRLFPNVSGPYLTVTNLKVDGNTLPVLLEYQDTALRVELPQPLPPGSQTTISMDFSQRVPEEMGGNYGLYIYMENILALDQFLPIIPVYDDEGWNVENPPQNADMVFHDVAFFTVQVSAPADLVLAGSGVKLDSTEDADRQTVTFVGGPQRDFFLAASPRFEVLETRVGDTRLFSYFPIQYRESGEMVLKTVASAMHSFNRHFGTYPFSELDIISTPMTAGGMEYSGAVTLSLDFYNADAMFGDVPAAIYLEAAAAHETGHQWFFNQVMNDQIDAPWMDEGLVQYATYLYYLDRYDEVSALGFQDTWYQRWGSVGRKQIPIGRPAAEYSKEEYSAIVYGRAPLFFAELSEMMGEETFSQFLLDYTDQYRWETVSEEELQQTAEDACGCDLNQVFEDWVE